MKPQFLAATLAAGLLLVPAAHAGKEGNVEVNGTLDAVTIVLGASAVMPNGLSAFAEYQTVLGLENVTHQSLSLGLRFEF